MLAPIDNLLGPGGLAIFGELHGTMEVPAFIARAADHAAMRGSVTVALELPDELQSGVDAFLAAHDDATGRAALLATPALFWEWRDGRGGEGLIVLLSRLRAIGARVVCIDGTWPTAEARDAGMAANLLAALRPEAATLAVCGNLHARTDEPRWMGWHVRQAHPEMVSLDLGYTGGTIWCCRGPGKEGVDTVKDRWPGPMGITLFAERHEYGWDGAFQVGELTPSMPLVR
jgi:hypothetical protein